MILEPHLVAVLLLLPVAYFVRKETLASWAAVLEQALHDCWSQAKPCVLIAEPSPHKQKPPAGILIVSGLPFP